MENEEKKIDKKEEVQTEIKPALDAEQRKALRGPDNPFYENYDGLD